MRHLGDLENSEDPLDPALLRRWEEVWVESSKGILELEIPIRMLCSGIAYLASKDRKESLLLKLKSKERFLLRQILKLDPEDEE